MGTLRDAKIYGGIGSILLLIGGIAGIFIPFGSIVIPIVGLILVLIAVKYVADALNRGDIFTNFIIFFVLSVVALVVLVGFVFAALFTAFGLPGPGFEFVETPTEADILALFAAIIVGLVVAWIIYIVAAIFFKKSFDAIADGLGVRIFHTTALLFLIGAILLIALGFGALLLLIAGILQIVAFFSIPEQLAAPAMAQPPPAAP